MTQDDLNNDPVTSVGGAVTSERKVKGAGMEEPAATIEILASVSLDLWLAALDSPDDAATLLAWIESHRA